MTSGELLKCFLGKNDSGSIVGPVLPVDARSIETDGVKTIEHPSGTSESRPFGLGEDDLLTVGGDDPEGVDRVGSDVHHHTSHAEQRTRTAG